MIHLWNHSHNSHDSLVLNANQNFTRNSLLHVPESLSTPAACPQGRPLLFQLIVQARQTLQSRGQIRCGWPHEFSMLHPKSLCFWEMASYLYIYTSIYVDLLCSYIFSLTLSMIFDCTALTAHGLRWSSPKAVSRTVALGLPSAASANNTVMKKSHWLKMITYNKQTWKGLVRICKYLDLIIQPKFKNFKHFGKSDPLMIVSTR